MNPNMRMLTFSSCVFLLGGCCFGLKVKHEEEVDVTNRIPVLDKCCPEDQVGKIQIEIGLLSPRVAACKKRERQSVTLSPFIANSEPFLHVVLFLKICAYDLGQIIFLFMYGIQGDLTRFTQNGCNKNLLCHPLSHPVCVGGQVKSA